MENTTPANLYLPKEMKPIVQPHSVDKCARAPATLASAHLDPELNLDHRTRCRCVTWVSLLGGHLSGPYSHSMTGRSRRPVSCGGSSSQSPRSNLPHLTGAKHGCHRYRRPSRLWIPSRLGSCCNPGMPPMAGSGANHPEALVVLPHHLPAVRYRGHQYPPRAFRK